MVTSTSVYQISMKNTQLINNSKKDALAVDINLWDFKMIQQFSNYKLPLDVGCQDLITVILLFLKA